MSEEPTTIFTEQPDVASNEALPAEEDGENNKKKTSLTQKRRKGIITSPSLTVYDTYSIEP
jgi:hypothetical protein